MKDTDYVKYIRTMVGHNKIIMNAAGAIIVEDDKILLQKRSDNNKWGLPGGIIEIGETYKEATKREIKEETGLDIKLDYLIGIYHNKDWVWPSMDEAHVIYACFKASIVSGTLKKDHESLDLKFFKKDEMPELTSKDHIDAVNDYFNGIKNNVE